MNGTLQKKIFTQKKTVSQHSKNCRKLWDSAKGKEFRKHFERTKGKIPIFYKGQLNKIFDLLVSTEPVQWVTSILSNNFNVIRTLYENIKYRKKDAIRKVMDLLQKHLRNLPLKVLEKNLN